MRQLDMTLNRAVTAIVGLELVALIGLALLWLSREPTNPLIAQAYGIQPWVPYAAIGFGVLTLLVLARWMTWPATHSARTRLALGLLIIAMLAFGGYAFRQLYLEVPATTEGLTLP